MKSFSIASWAFVFSLVLGSGCVSGLRKPAGESLGYPDAAWDHRAIRVCFGQGAHLPLTSLPETFGDDKEEYPRLSPEFIGAWTEDLRRTVRESVSREFTAERVGIEFTGWQDCGEGARESDLVLLLSTSEDFGYNGYASVGPGINTDLFPVRKYEGKKAYVLLKHPQTWGKWIYPRLVSDPERLALLALHEFGHVAGLAHEQVRLHKRINDPLCKWTMFDYADEHGRPREIPYDRTGMKPYGKYDPFSVMNYCFMDGIDYVTGLDFIIDTRLPAFKSGKMREIDLGKTEILADGTVRPIIHRDIDHPVPVNGRLPQNAIAPFEPSIFTADKLSSAETRYRIRLGLSLGDVHAIRCVQNWYPEAERARKCRPDFDPIRSK